MKTPREESLLESMHRRILFESGRPGLFSGSFSILWDGCSTSRISGALTIWTADSKITMRGESQSQER